MAVELYEHQKVALDLLRLNDGFCLWMEQGTGKTFPVLFRLAELAEQGRIGSALVVAPKAVCQGWLSKCRMLSERQYAALKPVLTVASYDVVWRRGELRDGTFDAVVLDEAHYVKTPSANRTKACIALCSRARYRYALTGTPVSNGQLCNLWSQLACTDPVAVLAANGQRYVYPRCLGGDSYYKWIDRVAYLDKWRKPYKYRDVGPIQAVMAEQGYRITKAECLDLPEKLPDNLLFVQLDPKAVQPYRKLARSSAVAEIDLLAENAMERMLRLRQMASGFVGTDSGIVEYGSRKLGALEEFCSDFEGKLVVFCEFRHSIDAVTGMLERNGWRPLVLDGRQADKGVWERFQTDQSRRAIVCQYQSGSAGIDLYAADTVVFFEPTLSSNLNEQAKDRIHRVGQTRACSYYYLLSAGTVEEAIYDALSNYSDFSEALFERYLQGGYTKGQRMTLE